MLRLLFHRAGLSMWAHLAWMADDEMEEGERREVMQRENGERERGGRRSRKKEESEIDARENEEREREMRERKMRDKMHDRHVAASITGARRQHMITAHVHSTRSQHTLTAHGITARAATVGHRTRPAPDGGHIEVGYGMLAVVGVDGEDPARTARVHRYKLNKPCRIGGRVRACV